MKLQASRRFRFDADEATYLFLTVTFLLFAVRDGLTGSLRYLFELLRLQMLWFIPDMLAFAALGLFVYSQFVVKKNVIGIYLTLILVLSCVTSVFFMNDSVFPLFSSIKMFIPMFVGFCFYGRSVLERRWVRVILFVICVASTAGLIANPYVEYPWVGQTISAFGMEREATKLWWQEGGVRYGGLAGDSTMAAYMVVFTFCLLAPYASAMANLAALPFVYWAIDTSTSKTAMGVLYLFILLYVGAYLIRNNNAKLAFLRFAARASFICLLIPPFLMIAFQDANLGEISSSLFSLQDRIDNTWPGPFATIAEIFPAGIVFGCGLGCYSYPMDYTDKAIYNLPLDNFYLTNLIMIGPLFIPFVMMQFYGLRFARDPVKLTLVTLFNFYSVTIQCFGPSYATLMFGYIFSEMFGLRQDAQKRATRTEDAGGRRVIRSMPAE